MLSEEQSEPIVPLPGVKRVTLNNGDHSKLAEMYNFASQLCWVAKISGAIQLFRQRLSHISVKAYVTMPIGIMGKKSLGLLDWDSWCFATREEKE